MNEKYDNNFNQEIERILKELYFKPINENGVDKRIVVETKRNYIQFLKEHDLATTLKSVGGNKYGLILQKNGYEVFEKYGSWDTYRKKVIDKKNKTDEAKNLAQRLWWIPIIISILVFLVSIISFFI